MTNLGYWIPRFFCGVGIGCVLIAISQSFADESEIPNYKIDQIALGKHLFEHEWEPNDSLSPEGDGLGPVFNANSCVKCHSQGGVGGGGDATHNVDMLFIVNTKYGTSKKGLELVKSLGPEIHTELSFTSGIVLHKEGVAEEYNPWRNSFFEKNESPFVKLASAETDKKLLVNQHVVRGKKFVTVGPLRFLYTQRNSSSMLGDGVIDSISDQAIYKLAESQKKYDSNVSGRVSEIPKTRLGRGQTRGRTPTGVGRFGWRAQTMTLRDFAIGACTNEVGLQTENQAQASDPFRPSYELSSYDLDREQFEALLAFMRSLAPPEQLEPSSQWEEESWKRGEALFTQVKCDACHVQNVERANGIYSDLLLHDMGPTLSETLPMPTSSLTSSLPSSDSPSRNVVRGTGYYSPPSPQPSPLEERSYPEQEWRTPPLWGVRDTAPYLHDGRAATLREAILAHGGEAAESVRLFSAASTDLQADLVAFLGSVGAPPEPTRKKSD